MTADDIYATLDHIGKQALASYQPLLDKFGYMPERFYLTCMANSDNMWWIKRLLDPAQDTQYQLAPGTLKPSQYSTVFVVRDNVKCEITTYQYLPDGYLAYIGIHHLGYVPRDASYKLYPIGTWAE